jgi:hypothetical protein
VRLDLAVPRLEGYRRDETGAWTPWAPDGAGRLWSGVLGLGLVLRGREVRAMTSQGEMLRTPREEAQARGEEAQARREEAQARAQADEEVARLRAALERLTHGGGERGVADQS